MTQLYVKFFGRKAGALGISYFHTLCIHAESESVEHVVTALYKIGYESVRIVNISVTTEQVLSSDERLYNESNGLVHNLG